MARRRNRKAMLGIETLIVFIAMIVVSAVAAGVLLKTVGSLQQRALAVGNEARTRVATGLEVSQVTAIVNVTEQRSNQVEILLRLAAGSYDIPITTLSLVFNSEQQAYTARLMNKEVSNYVSTEVSYMNNSTWINIGNFDLVDTDDDDDYARLVYNVSGNDDGLEFNLTTGGLFNVSLGDNIETNATLDIEEVPIKAVNGRQFDFIYGFITINGTGSITGIINESNNLTMLIESDSNSCTWDKLIPSYRYCYATKLGDLDSVLESGEIITFRYKLDTDSTIENDGNFDISLIPKQGTSQTLNIFVPEVFGRTIIQLWP